MKNELLTSFVELEKKERRQLCTIVKETLATGIVMPQAEEKKSFGVTDLWNLQRNMKTAGRNWKSRTRNFLIRG